MQWVLSKCWGRAGGSRTAWTVTSHSVPRPAGPPPRPRLSSRLLPATNCSVNAARSAAGGEVLFHVAFVPSPGTSGGPRALPPRLRAAPPGAGHRLHAGFPSGCPSRWLCGLRQAGRPLWVPVPPASRGGSHPYPGEAGPRLPAPPLPLRPRTPLPGVSELAGQRLCAEAPRHLVQRPQGAPGAGTRLLLTGALCPPGLGARGGRRAQAGMGRRGRRFTRRQPSVTLVLGVRK